MRYFASALDRVTKLLNKMLSWLNNSSDTQTLSNKSLISWLNITDDNIEKSY